MHKAVLQAGNVNFDLEPGSISAARASYSSLSRFERVFKEDRITVVDLISGAGHLRFKTGPAAESEILVRIRTAVDLSAVFFKLCAGTAVHAFHNNVIQLDPVDEECVKAHVFAARIQEVFDLCAFHDGVLTDILRVLHYLDVVVVDPERRNGPFGGRFGQRRIALSFNDREQSQLHRFGKFVAFLVIIADREERLRKLYFDDNIFLVLYIDRLRNQVGNIRPGGIRVVQKLGLPVMLQDLQRVIFHNKCDEQRLLVVGNIARIERDLIPVAFVKTAVRNNDTHEKDLEQQTVSRGIKIVRDRRVQRSARPRLYVVGLHLEHGRVLAFSDNAIHHGIVVRCDHRKGKERKQHYGGNYDR